MKFCDPKTWEVFCVKTAVKLFCTSNKCSDCRLHNAMPNGARCEEWAKAHPAVAARLMGLEVITDKEEPMKKDKPRICEVLGVEVGEKFYVSGHSGSFKVLDWGGIGHTCDSLTADELIELANYPDRIIHKPCFTREEVGVLNYACKCYDIDCTGILERRQDGTLKLHGDSVEAFFPGGFSPPSAPASPSAWRTLSGKKKTAPVRGRRSR